MFDRVGLIQIDSVNVLVRSQELPVFARLGPHPRDLLPRAAADGELFEYWGHEASLIPVEHHPLYRWKMARAAEGAWRSVARMNEERPGYVESIYQMVVERGPVVAGDLSQRTAPKGTWWDWDHAKVALEWLFYSGRVTARRRVNDFARLYDLPERMLPPAVLALPTPPEADARKALLVQAARSLGVATSRDLANYHRQLIPVVPAAGRRAGRGRPPGARDGRGLEGAAYLHPEAKLPAGSAPAPCSPRSTRSCGSDRGSSECSASTTGSRSTPRRRSGGSATTCCRSCWAMSSWPRRPEGRPRRLRAPGPWRLPGARRA